MDLINALQTIQKNYAALTEECIHDLMEVLEIQTIKKNEILVRKGQYSKVSYLILEGSIRVYYLKDDKDISDWFAFENEFVTPIVSFFGDKPSPHYIQAMEDCIVAKSSKDNIDRLCKKHPCLETFVKHVVTDVMLKQQRRISTILFYTAEEKYAVMKEAYQECMNRIPLKHVASHLGMTLETLSRVRAKI